VVLENPLLPDIARCEQVAVHGDAVRVEAPSDLHEPAPPRPAGAATLRAAHHARAFIDDGCAIQSGIGEAPARVIDALGDARGLRIRSGIASGGYRKLFECGAVADADHIAGIAWGDRSFLQWLAAEDPIAFAGVGRTHDIPALAREEKFTAINSAIEVDLFGQANVEWLGGRAVSGIGGALDFAQAAALSPQGRSLIVLPSVTASGASRIVARLSGPSVSLPRGLVDIVVTEHGAADLRGLSTAARAKALAGIAAPEHAEPLLAAARTIEG
jgi:acyl-CoA hydrolase